MVMMRRAFMDVPSVSRPGFARVCVALYTPQRGDLSCRDRSLLALPAHRIAELGIGRTFQNLALFPTLTVLQNVMVGVHARTRSDFLSNALRLPWVRREEEETRERARE